MPLDDNDKKFIADLIKESVKPETIGGAVKAHLDGLRLDDQIAARVKDATKDLAPTRADGEPSGTGKGSDEAARKLATIEKALQDERKAREEAEYARRRDQLDVGAREALAKVGVPADTPPSAKPTCPP